MVPKGQIHELRFDALEADPVGEIAKAYDALSLDGFAEFSSVLRDYVASLKGYKKNSFGELGAPTKAIVADRWARSFERGGYAK